MWKCWTVMHQSVLTKPDNYLATAKSPNEKFWGTIKHNLWQRKWVFITPGFEWVSEKPPFERAFYTKQSVSRRDNGCVRIDRTGRPKIMSQVFSCVDFYRWLQRHTTGSIFHTQKWLTPRIMWTGAFSFRKTPPLKGSSLNIGDHSEQWFAVTLLSKGASGP